MESKVPYIFENATPLKADSFLPLKSIKSLRLPLILLSIFLVFGFHGYSQIEDLPFKDGEKLNYHVSYNWEFIWVDAGKVSFSVESINIDSLPHGHFKSTGKSLPTYDWLFKVRDNFEAITDFQSFRPKWYERKTLEGNYIANNRLEFFPAQGIIISETENSNKPFSVDTLPYNNNVMDLLTAVYYARSLDFSKMQSGDKITLDVIIDGKIYALSGRYRGNENVENHDGRIYHCYRFSVTLVAGTIFKAGEEADIWLTADKNKIPILIEAGILVGSVKAYFVGAKNLKYPMESH